MSDIIFALIISSVSTTFAPMIITVLSVLFLFICNVFNIKYINMNDTKNKPATTVVLKKLSTDAWCSSYKYEDNKLIVGSGFFISKKYKIVGWIYETTTSTNHGSNTMISIYMLASQENMKMICLSDENEQKNENIGEIKIVNSYGQYWHKHFPISSLNTKFIISSPVQMKVVNYCLKNIKIGATILITGTPGCGKSSISEILAYELSKQGKNPVVWSNYNPFQPSNFLEEFLEKFPPTEKEPVIVCLDEFDKMVLTIESEVKTNNAREFVTSIIDKSNLSKFLDKLAKMENVITIATSNENLSWWNEIDRQYITRPGRFPMMWELKYNINDLEETFKNGLQVYNMNCKVPKFKSMKILPTIASICNAFKRCDNDTEELYKLLGCH